MSARLWCYGMAVVLALQGCALSGHKVARQSSPECNVSEGKCKLDIEVLDCAKPDGYKVSNVDLVVTVPSIIEWTIRSDGYQFRQDLKGIDITGKAGVFDRPQPQGPQKFSWRDKHKEAGKDFRLGEPYYYYINIQKNDGSPCAPFDPWISNF